MLHRTLHRAGRIANGLLRQRGFHITRLSYLEELEVTARYAQDEIESHQANHLAAETEAAWLRGELARLARRERVSADLAAQIDELSEQLREAHKWRREAALLPEKVREASAAREEVARLERNAADYAYHRAIVTIASKHGSPIWEEAFWGVSSHHLASDAAAA